MVYKYKFPEFFDGMKKHDFNSENGNIIIYGAGFQGLLTAFILKKKNLDVIAFMDVDEKKQGGTLYGLPIISPLETKEKYSSACIIVTPYGIAAAYDYAKNKLGFENVVTPYSLFLEFDLEGLDEILEEIGWYHSNSFDFHIEQFMKNCFNLLSDKKMFSCDISVTEICNLRCKNCTSLMPCYENPRHYTLDEMKRNLDIILENRVFYQINLEGGEIFIWKPFAEFLEYLCNFPNVYNVNIFTNGTVIPDERLLKALSNSKVITRISDYGKYSKIPEFTEVMRSKGAKFIVYMQKWYELSAFSKKPHSKDKYQQVISSCCKTQPIGNGTLYLSNNKLYHCPIQGNLNNLGIFKSPKDDFVDLTEENDETLQMKITKMFYKEKQPELCKYCDGRGYTGVEVTPAVQLKPGEKIEVKFE